MQDLASISTKQDAQRAQQELENRKNVKRNSLIMLKRSLRQCEAMNRTNVIPALQEQFKEGLAEYIQLGGKPEDIAADDQPTDLMGNPLPGARAGQNGDLLYSAADPTELDQAARDILYGDNGPAAEIADFTPIEETREPDEPVYPGEPAETPSMEDSEEPARRNFDLLPLPSRGECYKKKIEALEVSYLTAADEDLIMSPNLYQNGAVIDYLLKRKILTKGINPDELCRGDRDAIILWLRATAYDPQFPVLVHDPDSGEEVEAVVDLTTIKQKPFSLKGDENGWFDFKLPKSGDLVKFKFLTRKDEKTLDALERNETAKTRKHELRRIIGELNALLKADTTLNTTTKPQALQGINIITRWCDLIPSKDSLSATRSVTNMLEMSVMAVNGNTNRRFISNYVKSMPAGDSLALRRHISDNEPGMDFNVEAEKPKSLGGGSIKTFLRLDDTVFLNLA